MAGSVAHLATQQARLMIDHAGHVKLAVADLGGEVVRVTLDGRQPRSSRSDREFRFRYPSLPLIGWIVYWRDPSARITIDPSEQWSLRFTGGAASVSGDLRSLGLEEVQLQGGVKRIELDLPTPSGVVGLRFRGGVGQLLLRRPAGVPLRLHITGGAGHVELDGQQYGSMGGPIAMTAGATEGGQGRYEIEIKGGAGRVVVS